MAENNSTDLPNTIQDFPNTIQDSLAQIRPHGLRGAGGPCGSFGPKTHALLTFVLDSYGLGSVLTIEGFILDPCYEIWT